MSNTNTQVVEHEEFHELNMMLEWFKQEWGDDLDPLPDDVVEYEEDYELKDINQHRMSSEEV